VQVFDQQVAASGLVAEQRPNLLTSFGIDGASFRLAAHAGTLASDR
jgi:hypothetical protein